MNLLTLVLLVAVAAWAARKLIDSQRRGRAEARWRDAPGASPDNPIELTSRQVFDDAVERVRCHCGGDVKHLGETTRLGLRVALGRCETCDADVDVYFVIPKLLH